VRFLKRQTCVNRRRLVFFFERATAPRDNQSVVNGATSWEHNGCQVGRGRGKGWRAHNYNNYDNMFLHYITVLVGFVKRDR